MDRRKNKETERIIEGIKKFKISSRRKFGIDKIIIFGSLMKGELKEDSDIDLILVSKKFERKKFFKRPIGLYKYWKLNYPVDFICYSPKEFEKLKRQVSIVSEAIREGVEI